MNDLYQALADITVIRSQIARTTEFRGYSPIVVAVTGALALGAAILQERLLPGASHDIAKYLMVWVSLAIVATSLIGAEMVFRSRAIHSGLAQEMIGHAMEQLVPAGVAGALITAVLVRMAPETVWILPGLWQVLLSLGACASARILPRAILAVGGWYLLSGLLCIWWLSGTPTLSPWAMGIPFAVGPFMAAALLQWSETRSDDELTER